MVVAALGVGNGSRVRTLSLVPVRLVGGWLAESGDTVGEGEINFSEPARAKMAMDDPVTFVEETKQMLNDVCSLLLGIPPEDFYASLDSESRRKTRYFKCNKGIFGNCLAYVGVTEDHKKVCCICRVSIY